jgi:hypothetical protein
MRVYRLERCELQFQRERCPVAATARRSSEGATRRGGAVPVNDTPTCIIRAIYVTLINMHT